MNDNLKKKIGERINAALIKENKKQKELAQELGVTDNTISYFVTGARVPNLEQITKIAKYLDTTTDYLLGITDVKTPNLDTRLISEKTGLSEKAISLLTEWNQETGPVSMYGGKKSFKPSKIINRLISVPGFYMLLLDIARLTYLNHISHKDGASFLTDEKIEEIEKLEQDVICKYNGFYTIVDTEEMASACYERLKSDFGYFVKNIIKQTDKKRQFLFEKYLFNDINHIEYKEGETDG